MLGINLEEVNTRIDKNLSSGSMEMLFKTNCWQTDARQRSVTIAHHQLLAQVSYNVYLQIYNNTFINFINQISIASTCKHLIKSAIKIRWFVHAVQVLFMIWSYYKQVIQPVVQITVHVAVSCNYFIVRIILFMIYSRTVIYYEHPRGFYWFMAHIHKFYDQQGVPKCYLSYKFFIAFMIYHTTVKCCSWLLVQKKLLKMFCKQQQVVYNLL